MKIDSMDVLNLIRSHMSDVNIEITETLAESMAINQKVSTLRDHIRILTAMENDVLAIVEEGDEED